MRNYVKFFLRSLTVTATQHPSGSQYTFPVQLACDDEDDAAEREAYFMAGFTQNPATGTTYEVTARVDTKLYLKLRKKNLDDIFMALTIAGIDGNYTPITYLRATPTGVLNGRPAPWEKDFVDKSPRKREKKAHHG